VAPPGELVDETYASSFILAHSLHYVTNDVIHKTGSIEYNTLPSEEDQTTATVTIRENLVKFGYVVFRYASRQTSRQTDIRLYIYADALMQYFAHLLGTK